MTLSSAYSDLLFKPSGVFFFFFFHLSTFVVFKKLFFDSFCSDSFPGFLYLLTIFKIVGLKSLLRRCNVCASPGIISINLIFSLWINQFPGFFYASWFFLLKTGHSNFSEFWKSEFPSSLRFAVLNCWRPHCVRPVFWEMCLNGRTLKNKPKNTTCLSLYGLSVLGTLLILSQTIYYSTLAFTSWLHRAYRSALSPYLGTSQVFSECFLSWARMWFSKLPSTHTCFWMPQHPKEPFPSLAFPPRF